MENHRRYIQTCKLSNCLWRHSSSSSAASATINSEDGCACIVDFFLFFPPFPFRTDDAAFAFSSLCNVLKHPAHKSYSSPFGAHAPHANRALPGNIYKEHPSHVRGSSHTSARSMSASALPMSSSMFALNLTIDGVLGRLMTPHLTKASASSSGRCRTASRVDVVSPGSLVRFAPTKRESSLTPSSIFFFSSSSFVVVGVIGGHERQRQSVRMSTTLSAVW